MHISGIIAIGKINEAIDSGDPALTLEALQLPGAKLSNIDPRQMAHYQVLLSRFKEHKAEVSLQMTPLSIFK